MGGPDFEIPNDDDVSPSDIQPQAALESADLSDASLVGADLGDADLHGANLTNADLREADLRDADLREANLTDADLREVTFTDADLREADLIDVKLYKADLTDAILKDADLTDATLHHSNLTGTDLEDADLSEGYLIHAELNKTYLKGADLLDANLFGADCSGAYLMSTDFTDANLRRADFTDADLRDADLTNVDLREADLTNTDLREATLTDAWVERATLVGTELFDADLTRIRPYGARISDVQINDGTAIDASRSERARWWQRGPLTPAPRCGYESTLREDADDEETNRKEVLAKAADTYKQFEDLAHDNTMPSVESSMFVRRQLMQRKLHRARREPFQYLFAIVSGSVFKYGESLARVFLWALLIIVGYAAVYIQFDLIRGSSGQYISSIVDGLYFSTLTFTTLGLGDFQPDPASQFARALVTSQAALGAIMIALFVFVLGRRAAR